MQRDSKIVYHSDRELDYRVSSACVQIADKNRSFVLFEAYREGWKLSSRFFVFDGQSKPVEKCCQTVNGDTIEEMMPVAQGDKEALVVETVTDEANNMKRLRFLGEKQSD